MARFLGWLFLANLAHADDTVLVFPTDAYYLNQNRIQVIQPLDRNFFNAPANPEVTIDRRGKARYYSYPRNNEDLAPQKPDLKTK